MKPIHPSNFIQLSGPLFEEVQRAGVFSDSKTFVDCIPKSDPSEIMDRYNREKHQEGFELKAFVESHFRLPKAKTDTEAPLTADVSMEHHIDRLWDHLSRSPDEDVSPHSSLIPLPHPYIVPGGRFREIYYWDTYFTSLGLAASGHIETVENLARNFAWLIEQVGHVPNGNRCYYVSRSQPPFLVMLVDLIAQNRGSEAVREYLPALKEEYGFWMDGRDALSKGESHRRLVNIEGDLLNRYWDDRPLPREESWREDLEVAEGQSNQQLLYRHLRAGAESGWDFSSRWLRDGSSLETIHTTDILPVDLNALLYLLELKLGQWSSDEESGAYARAAQERKQQFDRYFWNSSEGFYFDYDWKKGEQTDIRTLAATYPLFAGLADSAQAESVAERLESEFLKAGGLLTSLHETGEQWDSPNGWAPLQWIAVVGLQNYGFDELSAEIARRWVDLNRSVFDRTGKMMEKYNVVDLSLEGGGGEYPLQDGFGWTNGVVTAMRKLFGN